MDTNNEPLTTVAARLMAEAETESGEADEVMGRYARKFRTHLLNVGGQSKTARIEFPTRNLL